MFEFVSEQTEGARIKVAGVGGAGGNAVNRMVDAGVSGVDFIAMNTDAQALTMSHAPFRIQIGEQTTSGRGSGGQPEVGRRAVEESRETLYEVFEGSEMVFVTAGMGGGTGTGASPVVAEVAREIGALTVGIVTKPFEFEGRQRMRQAEEGIAELRAMVDTLIVIPNQRLLTVAAREVTFLDAFAMADEVLLRATRGISELITMPALVNLDFADVKTIMRNMGNAIMGTGTASGEGRATEATNQAISSPLLEDLSIAGARGVLISVSGGPDMTLHEVNDAVGMVCESAGPEANIIFGALVDEELRGEVRVTVVATGIGTHAVGDSLRPRAISAENRIRRLEPVADIPDLHRPAFQRREGMIARWKTQMRQVRRKDEDDDLDSPTFLRVHAD
ncbi:MAG: cell division protein FtsZ [Candidatus Latescibacterota bacterium]|nr:MAG: cell division protein FtsZ [Candidatus Latescibacterota bacterium]